MNSGHVLQSLFQTLCSVSLETSLMASVKRTLTRNLQVLATRQDRLDALQPVPISSLAGHACVHCRQLLIDPSTIMFHPLPFTMDQCLRAAADGCVWYGILMNYVKKSQKPADELNGDRFILDFKYNYKSRLHISYSINDITSVTIRTGTAFYSWPCIKFNIFAETGDLPW